MSPCVISTILCVSIITDLLADLKSTHTCLCDYFSVYKKLLNILIQFSYIFYNRKFTSNQSIVINRRLQICLMIT